MGEIGGNKILIEDSGTRIFLDFGMSFSKRAKFFEEFLKPRTANGIGDFLAMGLVPDIRGIYRDDLLSHMGRNPEEPGIDAVFLSHAHADHANYITFLHKDIPIYCGETCKSILDAVNEQSQRSIECEVVDFKPRPLFRYDYRKPPIERPFKLFRTGDKIKVGSLEIEPIHVDHSVPGAYGLIVWTSEGPVIYTGDLRLHGMQSHMTEDFIERSAAAKPIAMITEGTRVDAKRTNESEERVYSDSKKAIEASKGLCIVDFNFKDVDRFKTFFRIANETKRELVINFKHACFLDNYHKDKKLNVPDSAGEGISILKQKVKTGTYNDKEDYSDRYIKDRLGHPNLITANDILKRPSHYMLVLNFWYFNNLVDLKPNGSLYIHSLSEPFNEEMEISFERMKNWLDYFNMDFRQIHCSGHINGEDLMGMIKAIKPKTLFPIHTEKPELFNKLQTKVVSVKEGETYKI